MRKILACCSSVNRYRLLIGLIAAVGYLLIPMHTAGGIFGKSTSFSGRYVKQVDPYLPLLSRSGDLEAIQEYGVLRVLIVKQQASEFEMRLLKDFTRQYDLDLLIVNETDPVKANAIMLAGHADILLGAEESSFADISEIEQTFPFNTESKRGVRWSTRQTTPQLKLALNHQINRYLISMGLPARYKGDLPGLKSRKVLRVAMEADPHNYFLKNGRPVGFEYDLLNRFARKEGLWLDVILARNEEEMQELLRKGGVDLISVKGIQSQYEHVSHSLPFNPMSDLLIAHKNASQFKTLADLNGKTIAVYSSTLSEQSLEKLTRRGIKASILSPEKGVKLDEFLERVSKGQYEVALLPARSYIQKANADLKIIGTTDQSEFRTWGFNTRHALLEEALNTYLAKVYQSGDYNFTYKKYHPEEQPADLEIVPISPYDHLVRKYAADSQFDWRLISAQMYQESQFKPNAVSVSGARGLMQIMPATAKEVGLRRVNDPEKSIEAGIKYMKKLRDRYGDQLPPSERNWFTLAAYNAGFGRIQDARRYAEKLGLDPDRWFDNVEVAMHNLADRKNRKHTRFGGCDCRQTVVYVRSIKRYYNSYIQLTDPLLIAANEPMHTGPERLRR